LKFAVTRLIKDQVQGWKEIGVVAEFRLEMDAIEECERMQELMKESNGINYGVEPI